MLCHAEDPVLAAKRAAPYTHLTHTKDAIMFFCDKGYTRQGRAPGQGILDWPQILRALAEYSPGLRLSIEDHKWLFTFAVFEEDWLALHPDLTCAEFGKVISLVWQCETRIRSGDLPDPQEYEAIPYLDQMLERLYSGRDYLRGVLAEWVP